MWSLIPVGPVCGQEETIWPLDIETRYLTSNFMEYRSGRFHAGIDLKTDSRTGYTVRAVEDGYISRIRTTPFAYGRAVYQRGDSGKTYVYAHLMRFNDHLRRVVRLAQEEASSYRTSLSFKTDEIRVRQGDALGLSGQSGTNGPHLHFEVRDGNQQPINPMDQGFAVQDTFAPVIQSIRAWPTNGGALANGSNLEQRISVPAGSGRLPALSFQGPIAFSAKIVDAADIRGHRLEPKTIEVHLDGALVYRCSNEIYNFEQNSLQRLEWADWVDWEQESVREHWLHRRPANSLTGRSGSLWYQGPEGQGLTPEDHLLAITATDHAGGSTTVEIPLVPFTVGQEKDPNWKDAPLGIYDPEGPRLTPFLVTGDFSAQEGVLELLSPANGDPVLEELNLLIAPWSSDNNLSSVHQGLESLGPAALFLAADWPIDSSVMVAFPAGCSQLADTLASDPRLGVYRQGKDRQWGLVGSLLNETQAPGKLMFSMGSPGLHAVMRDTLAPSHDSRIQIQVGLQKGTSLPEVTLPVWEVVPVFLADSGAGVDPGSILATLDGRPLIVEPDLPRDRVLIELPDDLTPGGHQFYLEASDMAGNASSHQLELVCRKSEG